ncbi:pentatricopeptide repeat-containing protein At2g30780 [Gastrolobium bilobum]|uniref:pentatricopeptide repeat-containing protein At2g30780 n=1 Tax=Gastrolobium bilobum TaxID=150636 RepID=UPI002AB1FB3F|nr:pentatricopeptide repeat-containing protein At2g30780 [Gastrolobium bilobum]XP_061356623.1 pentatricopeptide repeat-containing protein At2g30780 [Gastrolobium bilobum]
MKRMRRFSADAAQAELLLSQFDGISLSSNPKAIHPFTTTMSYGSTRKVNTLQNKVSGIVSLFTAKPGFSHKEELTQKVTILRNELVQEASDSIRVRKILDENSNSLSGSHPGGSALLELLHQLDSWPSLALEVFDWRRKSSDVGTSMTTYEYSKGIKVAGRSRNVDLAVEIFKEAASKGHKTTSTYNALMGAFMFNGHAERCQSLFCDMKNDAACDPSIATYNILVSVFGRLLLVDHMEATFKEMKKLDFSLNISTYNHLIVGYIAAWMWDDMEKVFLELKSSHVKPNLKTYLLMLRGYALSSNLEKMEETYSLVRDHVNEQEIQLIRSMICAYCKSSEADRIKKVEVLLKFIPEVEYRPWLNVLLIRLYAQEDCLEEMENAINEAFEHRTPVTTTGIMKCIIATYFRYNAVEKLETFISRAEFAGWRICRSLYHCKLVMYGSQKRFEEMPRVVDEMESVNIDCSKKSLWIMYRAYLLGRQRSMVLKILGQMFKHGYEIPLDAFPS